MYYLDKNIKDLVRIFDQNERKDYLRLDLNENLGGLPQCFIDEVLKHKDMTPQEIQRLYPEYEALVSDLKKANNDMMKFAELVKRLAFK